MLSKEYRLSDKKDIEWVFKKGYSCSHQYIRLKMARNRKKNPRFAFVVSNAVSKRAVIRNKIRRRMRAIIFQNLSKIKENFDVTIMASPQALHKNYKEIQQTLQELLLKSRLIKN